MTLNKAISDYDSSLQKEVPQYSGLLGLAVGGSKVVDIPSRSGYVYVRMRDSQSEVVQAFNDKVSPVYDFPVLIERRGNRWYVAGKDTGRYENWGTPAPYLPQHGDQHSFNRDGSGGGDTVFVYPDQFMPLLVYPSGTAGGSNLLIAPYALQRDNDFIYAGATGTGNLLIYKPNNANAIVGLVYLDKTTGNPGVLIASGTPMSASSTGTAAVLPYVPFPSSNQEPLYAFRLVSGTTSLTWSNLYNVRQFIGGASSTSTGTSGVGISGIVVQDEGVTQGTGTVLNFVGANIDVSVSGSVARVFVTGSAGGSLPSFMTGSIPFAAGAGTLTESNEALWWDEPNRGFRLGKRNSRFNLADIFPIGITAKNQDENISIGMLAYGTGTSGSPSAGMIGYRSRGSLLAQTPVKAGDINFFISGRGYDGSTHTALSRIDFFSAGDAVTGTYAPTGVDILVIPSGSLAARSQLTIYGNSVNQPTGSTYNVGGVPHTHQYIPSDGWDDVPFTVNYSSSDSPSFVINVQGNVTGTYGAGNKWKLGTVGTTKYFIQTSEPIYVSGTYTSINLYGGTDYTLTTGTISSPQISRLKSPFGFPLNPDKWTVIVTDSTTRSQAAPTPGTWYNLGSVSISAPIGIWRHVTSILPTVDRAVSGALDIYVTLSTANNSQSNSAVTRKIAVRNGTYTEVSITMESILNLSAKTTHYVNSKCDATTVGNIYNNNTAQTLTIRLICIYL